MTRTRNVTALAFGAVVVVGVMLRFVTRSDLWLDEALSVNVARLPFGQIAPWLKHDGAPPLYYWLLHGWMSVFGTGDAAVRSMSGVFGVAALPLAWWCGRRVGDARTAWLALLVLAVNPFAIRYATETRMYGMEIMLVFAGILLVRRAIERPAPIRLALVALVAAALAWTHYWALGMLGAAVLVLAFAARRSTEPAVRRALFLDAVAIVVGTATLLAWLATLRYQSQHTGTPWAIAQLPPGPVATSLLEFAGGSHPEGQLLVYPMVLLAIFGAFGVAAQGWRVELDARAPTSVRWEALVGLLGLTAAATIAWLGGSGYQPRYAAIALPFFVLVVAKGIAVLDNARLRVGAVVLVVACGLVGGVRNVTENRTQAASVAAVIHDQAKPGDVVVYCPDQLAPATHRLLGRNDLREVKYPLDPVADPRVGLVDWVDYVARLNANPPELAARRAFALAGKHAVFVVTSPGYTTHDALCPAFVTDLAVLAKRRVDVAVGPDAVTFEHVGLSILPAR